LYSQWSSLPGEADAAVGLDRRARHLPAAGGGGGRGQRRRLGQARRIGVSRPRGEVRCRARALGVQEHLGAAVRDGLEGPDRDPELLALLDVRERHVQGALADADHLRRQRRVRSGRRSGSQRLALATREGGEAAGRIDRRQRLGFGGGDQTRLVPLEQHHHGRAVGVGGQLGGADAGGQLPRDQAGQPACPLLVRPARFDHRGRHRAGEKRGRRARIAELLEQHGKLHRPQALAAVLLRDGDPGPAELDDLTPQALVVALGVGGLPHLGER